MLMEIIEQTVLFEGNLPPLDLRRIQLIKEWILVYGEGKVKPSDKDFILSIKARLCN